MGGWMDEWMDLFMLLFILVHLDWIVGFEIFPLSYDCLYGFQYAVVIGIIILGEIVFVVLLFTINDEVSQPV